MIMRNDMTDKDKKILAKFPEYVKGGEFVGTREFWEGVFTHETNRDTELHMAFRELHTNIVNEVIRFCKEHNLEVDEFVVSADGVRASRDYGEWIFATDSHMEMRVGKKDGKLWYVDREETPFLFEI